MKVLVLSDLHLEFGAFAVPEVEFDAVVLAGDIAVPAVKAVHWARRTANFGITRPVIYVPGNHEYYADVLSSSLANLRMASKGTNVHALNCDEVVLDDVRFLGCTLWTDFALRIDTNDGAQSDVARSMSESRRVLTDYRAIRVHEDRAPSGVRGSEGPSKRLMTPADTLALHEAHRAWLAAKLEEPFAGPTVVVTHHAPHRNSLAPIYATDWVSGAFASELPEEFFKVPVLWVHGHTHTSFDYRIGHCRVVCNPRGYMLGVSRRVPENDDFNPAFVVDIPTDRASAR
jgi:3',5'-cyclic AMP phosphodiesterase CpdA